MTLTPFQVHGPDSRSPSEPSPAQIEDTITTGRIERLPETLVDLNCGISHLGDEFMGLVRAYTWDTLTADGSPTHLRLEAGLRLRSILAPDEHRELLGIMHSGNPLQKAGAAMAISNSEDALLQRSLHAYMLRLTRDKADRAIFHPCARSRLTELLDHQDPTVATIASLNLRHYGSTGEKTAAFDRLLYLNSALSLSPHLQKVITKAISSHWSEATALPLNEQVTVVNLTGRSLPASWHLAKISLKDGAHHLGGSFSLSPLEKLVDVDGRPKMVNLLTSIGELRQAVVVIGRHIALSESLGSSTQNIWGIPIHSRPIIMLHRAGSNPDIEAFPISLERQGACVAFLLKPPVFCTFSDKTNRAYGNRSDELEIYGLSAREDDGTRQINRRLRLWCSL